MLFLLKKVITEFCLPLTPCLLISLVGVILLWFTKRQKAGKVLVTVSFLMLLLLSYGVLSHRMLASLEREYPAYDAGKNPAPEYVVVLGAGGCSDPAVPITSQLPSLGMVRLVEGIRIHRLNPGSKLVLSGGRSYDPVPEAEIMEKVAVAIGESREEILLETESRDTEDEAREVRKIVGDRSLVLVTSASHMTRALLLFRKQGMDPIPAPTNHLTSERQGKTPIFAFFPSSENLFVADTVVYEYLGRIWAKIRGKG
jgi:uncharacterized SAM-binding protein YcdF (DUF218 family)